MSHSTVNTSITCSLVCFPGMTSSLAKVNKSLGTHFRALFLKFPIFLMFLNIQIDLLILKTYDGQFTLTTNKSLHIIFNTMSVLSVQLVSIAVLSVWVLTSSPRAQRASCGPGAIPLIPSLLHLLLYLLLCFFLLASSIFLLFHHFPFYQNRPACFQAGCRRRWPNLALFFLLLLCYMYFLVKDACLF